MNFARDVVHTKLERFIKLGDSFTETSLLTCYFTKKATKSEKYINLSATPVYSAKSFQNLELTNPIQKCTSNLLPSEKIVQSLICLSTTWFHLLAHVEANVQSFPFWNSRNVLRRPEGPLKNENKSFAICISLHGRMRSAGRAEEVPHGLLVSPSLFRADIGS